MGSSCLGRNRMMCVLLWRTVYNNSREGDFGGCFLRCEAMWEINTKITLLWVHKQVATLPHTLSSMYRIAHACTMNMKPHTTTMNIQKLVPHYCDVTMGAIGSQITSLKTVYWTVYSDTDQRKHLPRITGLCVGNSPGTGEFPAQKASNAENVSIWWRHHDRLWQDEMTMVLLVNKWLREIIYSYIFVLHHILWLTILIV